MLSYACIETPMIFILTMPPLLMERKDRVWSTYSPHVPTKRNNVHFQLRLTVETIVNFMLQRRVQIQIKQPELLFPRRNIIACFTYWDHCDWLIFFSPNNASDCYWKVHPAVVKIQPFLVPSCKILIILFIK